MLYKTIYISGKASSRDCTLSFSCSCHINAETLPNIVMLGLFAPYFLIQFLLPLDRVLHSHAGGQQVFGLESVSRTATPLFRPSTFAYPNRPVPGSLRPLQLYQRTACISWPITTALHPCSLELPGVEIRGTRLVPSRQIALQSSCGSRCHKLAFPSKYGNSRLSLRKRGERVIIFTLWKLGTQKPNTDVMLETLGCCLFW